MEIGLLSDNEGGYVGRGDCRCLVLVGHLHLGGGVGSGRCGLAEADAVGRKAIKAVGLPVQPGEGGFGQFGVGQPRREGAAIFRDKHRVGRHTRTVGVVLAGPLDRESQAGAGCGQGGHRTGRSGGIQRDERLAFGIRSLGRIMRIDLVGGDHLAAVKGDRGDVLDFGAIGQVGLGFDGVGEVAHATACAIFGRQKADQGIGR